MGVMIWRFCMLSFDLGSLLDRKRVLDYGLDLQDTGHLQCLLVGLVP